MRRRGVRHRFVEFDPPAWAAWRGTPETPFTVGIEEELMLLDERDWSLVYRSDEVVAELPDDLRERVSLETHAAVVELTTRPHERIGAAVRELADLRARLEQALGELGLRPAAAGTHPSAVWRDSVVTPLPRYRAIAESTRVLGTPRAHAGDARARGHPRRGRRDPGAQPDAGPSPPAAGAVRQLAVLAGPGHRARRHPPLAVRSLSALGPPAPLPRLPRLGGHRRDARPRRGDPRLLLPLVGPAPAAPPRHARGAHHGRPVGRRGGGGRWPRSCSRSSAWRSTTRPPDPGGRTPTR